MSPVQQERRLHVYVCVCVCVCVLMFSSLIVACAGGHANLLWVNPSNISWTLRRVKLNPEMGNSVCVCARLCLCAQDRMLSGGSRRRERTKQRATSKSSANLCVRVCVCWGGGGHRHTHTLVRGQLQHWFFVQRGESFNIQNTVWGQICARPSDHS
jgi:hypothetical protein